MYLSLIPTIYEGTPFILEVLGYFFVVYCPFKEPPHLPPIHDLAPFSSNLAWSIGRDQWEEEEEEELQEVAFWGPFSNFPLCSC